MAIQSMISRALDNDNYFVLGSLDLSAAFDVVNRDLLFKRMETMGIPDDLMALIRDWLSERICFILVISYIQGIYYKQQAARRSAM